MTPEIISFKHLRRLIGILALSIAPACILTGWLFGGNSVQPSISAYYWTNSRDLFEAILVGCGAFIICYRGYDLLERIIFPITGIFGIGIALFPVNVPFQFNPAGIFKLDPAIANILHLSCAGVFFALLGFISFFCFTKTDSKGKIINMKCWIRAYPMKAARNRIYRICGATIAACGLAIAGFSIFAGQAWMDRYCVTLILEWVMLTSFGISWLCKGETLFKDKV